MCACVFSASHDDRAGQGSGHLHEKRKREVLVHLAIVRNGEFQQFGPRESERAKEWMSLFSSFSPSSGAPLGSVQTPIVAMSLSSLGPRELLLLLKPPVFTHQALLLLICLLFLASFWKKI